MNYKSIIFLGCKLIVLTLILFTCFTISSQFLGFKSESIPPKQAGRIAGAMLGICFTFTAVLAYPVLRSQWYGWRLMVTTAIVFFGIVDFLSQIESNDERPVMGSGFDSCITLFSIDEFLAVVTV